MRARHDPPGLPGGDRARRFRGLPGPCGPVEVILDEVLERPRICHAFADCVTLLAPGFGERPRMAEAVDVEIGRHLLLGMYCDDEDLPVHAWGGAP